MATDFQIVYSRQSTEVVIAAKTRHDGHAAYKPKVWRILARPHRGILAIRPPPSAVFGFDRGSAFNR
jgi:hypothetical protein